MASNRHLCRIIALQSLYEYDFRNSLDIDELTTDIDEVLDNLYDDELEYLIKVLKEEGHLKDQTESSPKSIMEMEWDEVCSKLQNSQLRLTAEEEAIIKSIANRL